MDTISLLITVILFAALIGKNKSPYARIILGSMIGVLYFVSWRYYIFYSKLYDEPVIHRQFIFLGLITTAIVLASVLIRIKFYKTIATVSLTLFIASALFALFADTYIKNEIAIFSGYYAQRNSSAFTKKQDENLFTQTAGNYVVAVPSSWQLRKDKGPLFPYYQWHKNDKLLLEFRPRCFDASKTTIPEISTNIRDTDKVENLRLRTKCVKDRTKQLFSCRANQYRADNQLKRIEYIATSTKSTQGIELDFVLSEDTPGILKSIKRVIESTKPLPGSGKKSRCLGLAEWM